MAAYERHWPIGTRQRGWIDVLLYTGLRRGDAVRFGRQHVRDGVGALKTEKSGFTVVVTLPILPVLAETLAAGPCGDLTFIVGEIGQPLTKESFGNLFRAACKTADVPGSAHDARSECRGDSRAAGGNLRLVRRHYGVALHALRRSPASCRRGDAQARERTMTEHLVPHLSKR